MRGDGVCVWGGGADMIICDSNAQEKMKDKVDLILKHNIGCFINRQAVHLSIFILIDRL